MRKTFALLFTLALLSGCSAGNKREIPQEPTGSDELRKSPCVCQQLDFKQEGYKWIG